MGAAFPACALAWFQTFDLPADYLAPHELFHLFGFRHSEETHPEEREWGGIPMSRGLTTGVNAAGTDFIEGWVSPSRTSTRCAASCRRAADARRRLRSADSRHARRAAHQRWRWVTLLYPESAPAIAKRSCCRLS